MWASVLGTLEIDLRAFKQAVETGGKSDYYHNTTHGLYIQVLQAPCGGEDGPSLLFFELSDRRGHAAAQVQGPHI